MDLDLQVIKKVLLEGDTLKMDSSPLSPNDMIQKVVKDKDFFMKLLQNMVDKNTNISLVCEEKNKLLMISYGVFLGSYYHFTCAEEKRKWGNVAINYMQVYTTQETFPYYNNMLTQAHYYCQQLPLQKKKLELQSNKKENVQDTKWKPLNPFLTMYDSSSFLCGIRVTDFERDGTRYYSAHGGKIQNYYEIQKLGKEFNRFEFLQFKDQTKGTYKYYESKWVDGFEDYRVAPYSPMEQKYALCVSVNAHEKAPRESILHWSITKDNFILSKLVPLWGEPINNDECQKNWLPFYVEDEESPYYKKLLAIYKSHPNLEIIEINPETGECSLVCKKPLKLSYHFRGGSPPVQWKDGYIFTIHLVGFLPTGRVYYHRLVYMDSSFNITQVSHMFYLNSSKSIEYISGAISTYSKGFPSELKGKEHQLYIAYGYDDNQAWIGSISETQVEKMFELE